MSEGMKLSNVYICRRCGWDAAHDDAKILRQAVSYHSLQHKEQELIEAEAELWA
jgi:hypothetical protein